MAEQSSGTVAERLIALAIGTIAIIFVLGIISLINYGLNRKNETPNKPQPPVVVSQPSEFPDYDAIKTNPDPKIRQINFADHCGLNGCVNNNPASIEFDGIEKKYKVQGKFSRAYLYVEALVDYKRPLTAWDDVYFTMNQMGGHLISSENILPVPASSTSIYLYDMRELSYYPDLNDKKKEFDLNKNINFFNLLQDGLTFKIHAALSSDRPGRVIKEFSIYYECYEGSDCKIGEVK